MRIIRKAEGADRSRQLAGLVVAVERDDDRGMRRGTRRIVTRLADVACPPEDRATVRTDVVDDVASHIACMPALGQRTIGPALFLFDQLARARSGGRRFLRLDDDRARAYLEHVLTERSGPVAIVVRLVKGLLALYYYERPIVAARMGYAPDAYIAEVSARRLRLHGEQIEAVHAAEQP
jgi:hypothetical protein